MRFQHPGGPEGLRALSQRPGLGGWDLCPLAPVSGFLKVAHRDSSIGRGRPHRPPCEGMASERLCSPW